MDSDLNSNQFLGSRRGEAQNWPVKTLPLMDRTSFLPMLLFIFVVADVSNASHRFLIDDPPKVNSDISTAPGKDSPVASPPPPPDAKVVKPLSNDVNNKTEHVMPAKTPDPNPDPNNTTKTVNVAPPTDTGDGKNNHTSKDPAPEPEKTKKDPAPEPEKPKKDPAPEPEKPKMDPAPEPEKPKKDPAPEPEKKPGSASPPPPPPEGGKEGAPEIEKTKKSDNASDTSNVRKESCDVEIKTCRNSDMVACIVSSNSESTEAVILVQNLRDSTLKGYVSAEGSTPLVIRKHKSEKFQITLDVGKSNKIVVKAGNKECVLQMDPFVSEGNFFIRFPSYEKVVTPINGAYFLIVTIIIFGGMWACCLIRRRKHRTGGGVPYQELEMALPESAAATEEVTAEGWDQGWDDDWDGDNAVKPGGHLVGSISANGLTARSSNKDGWENNWDD